MNLYLSKKKSNELVVLLSICFIFQNKSRFTSQLYLSITNLLIIDGCDRQGLKKSAYVTFLISIGGFYAVICMHFVHIFSYSCWEQAIIMP